MPGGHAAGPAPYPVLDVSTWRVHEEEAQGTDEKSWLVQPETQQKWLFKPNTTHADPAWMQREDWSEKIVGELGASIELPCARIELAIRMGKLGCISLDLNPPGWEFQSGAVLLSGLFSDYISGAEQSNKQRKHHSLANIKRALSETAAPPGTFAPPEFGAFDVFAGYVTLDAVVANQDRHDENWAIMRSLSGTEQALAGSYDHARALGSTLRESKISGLLQGPGVEQWTAKGMAHRFEHTSTRDCPSLVDIAVRAMQLVEPPVRAHWLDRISALNPQLIEAILGHVPKMSVVLATFVEQVVAVNRRRVLDEC